MESHEIRDWRPLQPHPDWEREADSAVQSSLNAAELDRVYRNLSGLSADQLSWTRRNHMEPAPPGIPWNHARVEYTPEGIPIIWVNDHCVVIPMMMLMFFCQIGHIEPKGDLFEHMHEKP